MEKPVSYATENKILFYRSRFTIAPESENVGEIWPHIVTAIQGWLEEKEDSGDRGGSPSFLIDLTDDVVNLCKTVKRAKGSAYASQRLANGTLECDSAKSSLTTKALFGQGAEVPSYWAMEYAEDDKEHWYRRWYTNIGVTAAKDGSYIVNVRVAIADDPAFICDRPYIPPRTTPRFVGRLLDIDGCAANSNGIYLANEPQILSEYSMGLFREALESGDRTIPLIVVSAMFDQPGTYAIDPYKLATKVRGSAVVYTLDCSNFQTQEAYKALFLGSDAARNYRINPGFMRVFFPGVDLEDAEGYRRHRFYTNETLKGSNPGRISNDVCGAFTRLYRRVRGEALDPASIVLIESQLKRKQLEQKLEELRKRRGQEEREQPSYEGLHTEEELKQALEQQKAGFDAKISETTSFYEEVIAEYEAEAKQHDQGDDVLELQIKIDDLTGEIKELQRTVNAKDHSISVLNQRNEQSESQARQAQAQASIICQMQSFPQTCEESLNLAEQAFSSRLAVTESAKEAARNANKSISSSETFDILRCLAVNLWPKYFEQDETDGTAGYEFQNETGYELAFHESTQTNKDQRLQKLRQVTYDGRSLNITPHVKGKTGNRNAPLRVHFAIDKQTEKIVVGHCGEHMETAGTRKVAK